MDISRVLAYAYPGKQFVLNGNDYSELDWLDESPKPSLNDLEAKYPLYLAEQERLRKLTELPFELDAVFNALPANLRAQFFPLKASVKLALDQADLAAAREIVLQASVSTELAALKQSMINAIDSVLNPE